MSEVACRPRQLLSAFTLDKQNQSEDSFWGTNPFDANGPLHVQPIDFEGAGVGPVIEIPCLVRYLPGCTPHHFLKARRNALDSWNPKSLPISSMLNELVHR